MEIQVRKIPQKGSEDPCLIPRQAFDYLNLSTDVIYEIHVGQRSQASCFNPDKTYGNYLCLPENIFDKFLLIEDMALNIWIVNKDIYLGPVIGIFETPKTLERIATGGAEYYEIQHMKASISENCLSYYFSVEDIDWETENVRGITFLEESDEWGYFWLPMPNVIYDEGVFLTKELKQLAKQIRKGFRNYPDIQFINSRNGLNKWELCERLSKYPSIRKYIPETIIYTAFDDIHPMLEKHHTIFLKSFYGSKGQEVLSVERDNGMYKVHFYDYSEQELKEFTFSDGRDIKEFINDFFEDSDLVIQQGIRLLKFHGHNFDMRVMLQKYDKGIWECSFVTCRIAKGCSTITNVSAGGSLGVFELIYPELCSQYGKELVPDKEELIETAITIATHIEREFGPFGELGMDMAIDSSGKIWLIEANAKPDKGIDLEHTDITYGKPVTMLLLEIMEKSGSAPLKGLDSSEVLIPQALATFKYAKFLTKCK